VSTFREDFPICLSYSSETSLHVPFRLISDWNDVCSSISKALPATTQSNLIKGEIMKSSKWLLMAGLLFAMNSYAVDENASKTFPTPQSAEDAHAYHVGVVGGYVDPNGELKGSVGYGVDLGFQPVIPFGIGLQALFYNASTDITGGRAGIKRTEVMARLSYNLGGETPIIRNSYLGVKFGAVFTKPYFEPTGAGSIDGDNYTRFGIAPAIGFDIPFARGWTAGLDASYLFVVGPEKQQDTVQVLAAVKYWF
jgi:hypothetical protein